MVMVNKKKTLGFVLLALVGAFFVIYMIFFGLKQQSLTEDSKLRSTYKNDVKLVAIGDSLTEGVGDTGKKQGYVKRVADLIKTNYHIEVQTKNYGKAGDRSDQILKRLNDSQMMQDNIKKANAILMTVGGNDLQQSLMQNVMLKSDSQLKKKLQKQERLYDQNLNRLISKIKDLNSQAEIFLFGNYNPIYVHFPDREILNTSVKEFNAINVLMSQKYQKVHYISVFKTLTYGQYKNKEDQQKLIQQVTKESSNFEKQLDDKNSNIKNEYITSIDNFHPNNKGYDYMAQVLFDKMKKYNNWLLK